MEIKQLLPIGSVVLLNTSPKKLMIFGVKQTKEDDNREFDYIGVPYPEGNIGGDYQFLFNHTDISAVIFRGFEDIERQDFINKLDKIYKK